MIVINSLIAVEVPRGVKYTVRESELAIFRNRALSVIQLPFPAEIIGLASGIDFGLSIQVIDAAKHKVEYPYKSSEYANFLTAHSLTTTPTTDIIFLRKKL